jgi:hypothetical protein
MAFNARLARSRATIDTLSSVYCREAASYQEAANSASYHARVHGLDAAQTADLIRLARHCYFDFQGGPPPTA